MPDLLSYQPSSSAVYYVSPRKFNSKRLALALPIAVAVVVGLAVFFGAAQPHLHSEIIAGAWPVMAGLVAGWTGTFAVRYGKVRAAVLATLIGVGLSTVFLYADWITWCYNFINQRMLVFPLMRMILHPMLVWRLIRVINHYGSFSYQGDLARGPFLWVLWAVEACLIMGLGVLIATKSVYNSDPDCRDCGTQCKRTPRLPKFAINRQQEFLASIEARDFAAMATHPAATHDDHPELSLRLMCCPRCGKTNVLTVNRIAWQRDRNRRLTVVTAPLINQLMITPEEAAKIKAVCEQIREQRKTSAAAPLPVVSADPPPAG